MLFDEEHFCDVWLPRQHGAWGVQHATWRGIKSQRIAKKNSHAGRNITKKRVIIGSVLATACKILKFIS
jgi:hypothetical protein